MQIDRIFFPAETLGYGKRIIIWTIGCPRRCRGCSNPELWETDSSREIDTIELVQKIEPFLKQADGITITGGDPFFQIDELRCLLENIRKISDIEILVYTGYLYEELTGYQDVLGKIDVLIDGPYVNERDDNRGIRGSSNQRIIVLNPKYEQRYADASLSARSSQIIQFNGRIINVGIPIKSVIQDS